MTTATLTSQTRVGRWTVQLQHNPRIIAAASVVGPREGAGPLGTYFDEVMSDYMQGETSAEVAERRFMADACDKALAMAQLNRDEIDLFMAGDLLNQTITSSFTARSLQIPFMGLFNACATIGEALTLASIFIDGDYAQRILVAASSHYQSAERQYRYPIELNIARKQTNQWTVSGAGAAVISKEGEGPKITHATVGRVVDYGLKDVNDMGCAMAPAAADTLLRHLSDTGRTVGDYDLILTGDLASYGKKMFNELVKEAGVTLGGKHLDAGDMMYSQKQQPGAGGSGAACSAVTIFGYVLKEMANTRWHRVLALPTGSLHNPLTYQQGESIPGIAHAIVIET